VRLLRDQPLNARIEISEKVNGEKGNGFSRRREKFKKWKGGKTQMRNRDIRGELILKAEEQAVNCGRK